MITFVQQGTIALALSLAHVGCGGTTTDGEPDGALQESAAGLLALRSPLAPSPNDVYPDMQNQLVIESTDSLDAIAVYDGDIYYVSNGLHTVGGIDIPGMHMYQKSYNPANNSYGPAGFGKIFGYQNAAKYVYKGISPAVDGVFTAGQRSAPGNPTRAVVDVWEHNQNLIVPRHSFELSTGANTEFTDIVRGPSANLDDDYVFLIGGTLGATPGQAAPIGMEDCFVSRLRYDAAAGFSGTANPDNYLQFGTVEFEELFSGVYDPDTNMIYVVGKTNGNLCAAYPTKAGAQCENRAGMDALVAGIGNDNGKLSLQWVLQFGSTGDDDLAKALALYKNPANPGDVRLFVAGATDGGFSVINGPVTYKNPGTAGINYQDAFLVSVALDATGHLTAGNPLQIVDSWGGDYGDVAGAIVISGDEVIVAGHHGGDEGHIALCDRTQPAPGSDFEPNTPANNPNGTGNFAPNHRIDFYTPYLYTYDAITGARVAGGEHEILNPLAPVAPVGDTGEQIMGIALDDAGRIHVVGQAVHSGASLAFKGARGTSYNNDCADGMLGAFTP